MFDNLKEKLGSFRDDAEAAAEENVEEVDDDELADAEPDDGAQPEAEVETETEAEAETDTEAEAETDVDADSVSESESPDTTAEPVDESVAEPESELEAEMAAPTETAEASAETDVSTTDGTDARESTPEPDLESEVDAVESGPDRSPDSVPQNEADTASEPADAKTETAEDEVDAEVDDEDVSEDNGGTGFGAKARSLVKGKFVIEEEDLEEPLHELEMALLTSDVEMGVAEEILDNIRDELVGETRTFTTSTGEVVEEALRDAIYDVISVGQFDFEERVAIEDKPLTIIFTGVNGVGKTTSIAKMSRYLEERGYSTVMANGDTYRAGANQQIQEHADALETKCISHEQGGDPAAVLYDAVEYAEANDIDVVLGDTAGRLHTDEGLMDQLEKIDRVVGPDMTLFVDEAVAGQDAVNRAREFDEAAEIDGAILSKADADSNGGAAISIAHVTGKPILFLGVGQGYDDLERFDPDEMIDRLLEDE
ncbi:signal recognition particle-docking protein FtsY [Natronococcus pandeyae]|uniref:Signal recognition particle receptor FtsY n=1 Tax=Natronococcus pandeyae TaxID=2055836 RepID=A0A8J8TTF4_9EURY|nr:signal recognition particle-docking protein FtsY [Natronococcus pandeyae]TYL39819.1 signal recognition particle-docking protein FtsY [Natronococcus pandeyae]